MSVALLQLLAQEAFAEPSVAPTAESVAPPLAASQGLVAVRFFTRGDVFTHARLDDRNCRLPCTVLVRPGVHRLLGAGMSKELMVTNVEIPTGPTAHVELRARSPAFTIAGGLMIPLGAAMAGSLWFFLGFVACSRGDTFDSACVNVNTALWPLLGGGILFTGIGFVIAGVTQRPTARVREPLAVTGLGIAPLPSGGAAASLRLSF